MSTDQSTSSVSAHYAEVALDVLESLDNDTVCGCTTCDSSPLRTNEAAALYARTVTDTLPKGAVRASRGCGDPVAKALLQPGETVLDLGCGGGIDALIASKLVGAAGQVYGIDMTPQMIELATKNAADAGTDNVIFIHGSIETLPFDDNQFDVVLSNCVINFSDNKPKAMQEACRVLKPNGRFVVSDIVNHQPIPAECYEPLCRIVGCTKGMSSVDEYRRMMLEAGFAQVRLEPKTTYTMNVLEVKARQKNRMEFFARVKNYPEISGASGSVIIYAYK